MAAKYLPVILPVSSLFAGFIIRCLIIQHYTEEKTNANFGKLNVENGRQSIISERSSDYSFTNVSILCWVMTSRENLFSKAIHITQTWGPRCNLTLYITDEPPKRPFPGRVISLPVKTGRKGLWGKTRAAFAFIFEHYRERFDWFLKADDDTYVIVDNVRYFLATKDTNEPSYFGNMFHVPKSEIKFDYMSGGAGYVINKEALRMFMSVMYTERLCPFDGVAMEYPEDVMVGYCLKKAGVTARSSLDSMGRARFLPLRINDHINGVKMAAWFPLFSREAYSLGVSCCSDYLVTFHYVKPLQMYALEYMTQRLRVASRSKEHVYHIDGQNIMI